MSFPFALLLSTLSFVSTIRCIAFPGPQQTDFAGRMEDGFSPKPTGAPAFGGDVLWKRYMASANTCGWVNGDADLMVSCGYARTCMLYTTSGGLGMVGCCSNGDDQDCAWKTRCIGYSDISRSCTAADCIGNPFVLLCSSVAAPYCVSWTYPAYGIRDFGCGTNPASTWRTVRSTATSSGYTVTADPPYADTVTLTGWGDTTTTPETTTPVPTPTPIVDPNPVPPSPNPALIAGAVVGGLFLLACVIAALVFICWWRRRQNRQQAAEATAAAIHFQQPQQPQQPQPSVQQPMSQHGLGMQSPPGGHYPSSSSATLPPYSSEQKLSPNAQTYPVSSTPSVLSPLSSNNSMWGSPSVSVVSPILDMRPASGAWSAAGPASAAPVSAVEAPADAPDKAQQHPNGLAAHPHGQNQPSNQVYEMGS